MNFLVSEFRKSVNRSISRFSDFLISALNDTLFLLFYGMVSTVFVYKITEYAQAFIFKIGENSANQLRFYAGSSLMSIIRDNPEARTYLNSLVVLFMLLMVVIYISYVFFQTISWKYVNRINKKNISFIKLLRKFSLLNLKWLPIIFIVQLLSLLFFIGQTSAQRINENIQPSSSMIFIIIGVIIIYFMFISYSIMLNSKRSFSDSFRIGLKKGRIVLTYLVIGLVFYLLNQFSNILANLSDIVLLVFTLIITIPSMTLFKVYFSSIVDKALGSNGKVFK